PDKGCSGGAALRGPAMKRKYRLPPLPGSSKRVEALGAPQTGRFGFLPLGLAVGWAVAATALFRRGLFKGFLAGSACRLNFGFGPASAGTMTTPFSVPPGFLIAAVN